MNNNLISKWLAGTLSEAEKQELEASGELDELKVVVGDIATWSVEKYDVEGGLAKLKERQKHTQKETKTISFRSWYRIAAVILLLAVAYLSRDSWANTEINIETQFAESQEIILPDESIINLDAFSSIQYDKRAWTSNRKIQLDGQAYFQVTKKGAFQVETSQGLVSVLGTKFNIKSEEGEFVVRCFEGSVLVEANEQSQTLIKGEAITLVDDSLQRFTHENQSPDWVSGYSEYEDALLSMVILDMYKYYEVEIDLPNKYTKHRFSGKFVHNDLEKALRSIFIPLEINYQLVEGNRVVFD